MRANLALTVVSAVIVIAPIATGIAPTQAAALSSKTIVKCQKAAQKGAEKLLKTRLKGLVRCTQVLLSCQLGNELEGKDLSSCLQSAAAKCESAIGKAESAELLVSERMASRCETVPDIWMVSRRGLGYRDASDACAALAPPAGAGDLAAISDCVARATRCAADNLLEQIVPRSYELLNAAGLIASHPQGFPCLDVRPASPATGGSTKARLIACQKAISGGNLKLATVRQKGLQKCSAKLLACQLRSDRLEISLAEGSACQLNRAKTCDGQFAKVLKVEGARDSKISAKCASLLVGDVKDGLGFALTCAGAATVDEVAACAAASENSTMQTVVGTVMPRTCSLLSQTGNLGGNEETCIPSCGNGQVDTGEACDDGNADNLDSCTNQCAIGPTAFETLSIASTAQPANTPDGTPANAVPPGSTLATQFGSTIFDLNKATYTRYYVPGVGDPNSVLILVPGFAGGAHDFKNLAEQLLVRAVNDASVVLEVWGFDRRGHQLEDLSGANLAEADLDPKLALDWFFGAEMGFTLDPRLSRRAVFHPSSDVAFMANFTPRLFSQDIDAVVEQAHALASNPAVFLGGHSLGTVFTARYAATDFDPGPGTTPGYSKLSGLVMFEGVGGSLPTAPPSSDDLDRIIAKADGALYHAVKNGDRRCVDGTPCPNGDVDCASVPLPPGALTNKCVDPVEAYLGADLSAPLVLITPQVQAASEIAGIQGILDPEGLVIVQQDFGSGSAVENVGGLGVLGLLPLSSAEAGVGFFLDDDFSPVSAFQASTGYSNNGPNITILFGILFPQAAIFDPYRLWIGIDSPQPTLAVPSNGLPSAWDDINGQEKEVSDLRVLFTAFMAGDTNFGDWYFPSSGLSVIDELEVGTVWASLDSTPLSLGRNRPDIANLTEATNINIPVIGFGGTNGLTPTPGAFKFLAESIGSCTAPSCTGATPRIVDSSNPVFPVFGGAGGGYEVYLSEGYAHVDILQARDDSSHNNVLAPLMDFLIRNTP